MSRRKRSDVGGLHVPRYLVLMNPLLVGRAHARDQALRLIEHLQLVAKPDTVFILVHARPHKSVGGAHAPASLVGSPLDLLATVPQPSGEVLPPLARSPRKKPPPPDPGAVVIESDRD